MWNMTPFTQPPSCVIQRCPEQQWILSLRYNGIGSSSIDTTGVHGGCRYTHNRRTANVMHPFVCRHPPIASFSRHCLPHNVGCPVLELSFLSSAVLVVVVLAVTGTYCDVRITLHHSISKVCVSGFFALGSAVSMIRKTLCCNTEIHACSDF